MVAASISEALVTVILCGILILDEAAVAESSYFCLKSQGLLICLALISDSMLINYLGKSIKELAQQSCSDIIIMI